MTAGTPTGTDALWKLTVEHSPVGTALLDADTTLISANRALCEMLGRSEDDLRAAGFAGLTHPDDLAGDVALLDQTLAGDIDTYRLTKRYLRTDGSVVWGDLSVVLVRDEAGEPLHFISQVVDVTSYWEVRTQLTETVERLEHERRGAQAVFETARVGLVLIDAAGRYERMNDRHADFMALAFPEGHDGQAGQLGTVFAPDGRTLMTHDEMPSARALSGEEFDDQRIWVGADPVTRRALSVSARTIRGTDGTVGGAALAYSDVTDLMRAVSAREDFVTTVSHELRTPLASVLNHLELLQTNHDLALAEVERSVEVAHRNARRLNHMVVDLLTSAAQRNGELVLQRSITDVAAVVQESVDAALPAARRGGVVVDAQVVGPLMARLDVSRFQQVVDNLVSNAVKYTEAGGLVEVTLSQRHDTLVLQVQDDGVGIEADDLPRIFLPFVRAQTARAGVAPGLGLGLAIARTIAEAHGGTITAHPRDGAGAAFVVELPVGLGS